MVKFKGIAYPLCKHHEGFLHHSVTDIEQIKSNLATIVLTEPGERVMEMNFGTPLMTVNTNSPKELVIDNFRRIILSSIKGHEKRIQINNIVVHLEEVDKELMVMISIFFIDPIRINNVEELHIQKSLGNKTTPF